MKNHEENRTLRKIMNDTTEEIIEFKPPGLYDRSFALMLDNEKRFNKINNNINTIEKKVRDETVGNYINKINRTPYIKRNNNSLPNLSIQNYSIFLTITKNI